MYENQTGKPNKKKFRFLSSFLSFHYGIRFRLIPIKKLPSGTTIATISIIVSIIVFPEIISALNRRLRESSLNDYEYETIKKFFSEDFMDMTVISANLDIALKTVSILESSVIRGMDSLHIATAVSQQIDLFLTSDKRQYEAALISGLKAEMIQ